MENQKSDISFQINPAENLVQSAINLAEKMKNEYTLSAILLYRALDFAVSKEFAKFEFTNWEKKPFSEVQGDYLKIRASLFPKTEQFLPNRIGFSDSVILIHLLENTISKNDIIEIVKATQIRHSCWLAHGKNIVSKHQYAEMKAVIISILERFGDWNWL